MGLAMGRLLGWKQETRIVLLGLGGAGKTAILHKLKLGNVVTTGPTIGFNAETLEYSGINFRVWDVGGHQGELLRLLLRPYLYGALGVIFVVDSSDQEWFHQAKDLLNMILNEDEFRVRDPALLVFATKQDRPNAMSAAEIADKCFSHCFATAGGTFKDVVQSQEKVSTRGWIGSAPTYNRTKA